MPTTMYNERVIPQLCEEQRPTTPKTAHDLCEEIRKCHIEAADILANVFRALTGNAQEVPGYKDPESMLMDLACEAERAEYIRRLAMDIQEVL